jgi:hypothetical protein
MLLLLGGDPAARYSFFGGADTELAAVAVEVRLSLSDQLEVSVEFVGFGPFPDSCTAAQINSSALARLAWLVSLLQARLHLPPGQSVALVSPVSTVILFRRPVNANGT